MVNDSDHDDIDDCHDDIQKDVTAGAAAADGGDDDDDGFS